MWKKCCVVEKIKTTGAATPEKKVKVCFLSPKQVVYLLIIHPMVGLVNSGPTSVSNHKTLTYIN